MKRAAGEKAVEEIKDGMTIGLGSGSTVYWTIKKIGERISQGLQIKAIPSSEETARLAKEAGIPLTSFAEVESLDLSIDGADEVDPDFHLIKGGGGALLREKFVDMFTKSFIVVIDESKLVPVLGSFPLPVEVVPFGWEMTAKSLAEFGCNPVLRKKGLDVFLTDNGNYILDCDFSSIGDPVKLHRELKQLTGVIETGLFTGMADKVIVGKEDGVEILVPDDK
ncbi:ribose-5-phosphate isomerase RpiA [Bacillus sp. KH172YL63]|uniref:ribose-5-phosphate isomerase RpiA n=1 Tax=Bacillus sp. KH172YL63 TaxID=2709784 RepID=UPI0013E4B3D7|nr:ribose-5-phosphate isomerase RpiA [Bacillus sp. KH172YL63]BCB02812.1 ribose-5-phosphate isomerase A [Bacillus sp. KH172YL63]